MQIARGLLGRKKISDTSLTGLSVRRMLTVNIGSVRGPLGFASLVVPFALNGRYKKGTINIPK